MQKKEIYGMDSQDFTNLFKDLGLKTDNTSLLMNLIYRQTDKDIHYFSQISDKIKNHLEHFYHNKLPTIITTQKAHDGTIKFLIQLSDGKSIEAVCLFFRNKLTLCLSSQVGCAMKCSFCHTATQGLKRNLSAAEIVSQYLVIKDYLQQAQTTPYSITNLVFMGQGEPLHNFDSLKKAIAIFTDPVGIGLGKHNITVSTSGYLPGLKRFKELGVNIALSLHSTNSAVRDELIPINKAYPLEEIMNQLDILAQDLGPRQSIVYEYLLIRNLNNNPQDVEGLYKLLSHRRAHINIIPFNEFPGSRYRRPHEDEITRFKEQLIERGLNVFVRKTKGDDILAACGQLKS